MIRALVRWWPLKWRQQPDAALMAAYRETFGTVAGQRVLQHLLDTVYCQVYQGKDPFEAAVHNGRRSVIQELLENLQHAEEAAVGRTEPAAQEEPLWSPRPPMPPPPSGEAF